MLFRAVGHPFLQTFLKVHLTAHLPNAMVSSVYIESVGVWGVPKEVRPSLYFLQARFTLECLVSASPKILYRDLIGVLLALPVCRSIYLVLP